MPVYAGDDSAAAYDFRDEGGWDDADYAEAALEPLAPDSQTVVNYYFPVEVVLVGSLPEEERDEIETRVWEKLRGALERMA
jgi:hypothetical protein